MSVTYVPEIHSQTPHNQPPSPNLRHLPLPYCEYHGKPQPSDTVDGLVLGCWYQLPGCEVGAILSCDGWAIGMDEHGDSGPAARRCVSSAREHGYATSGKETYRKRLRIQLTSFIRVQTLPLPKNCYASFDPLKPFPAVYLLNLAMEADSPVSQSAGYRGSHCGHRRGRRSRGRISISTSGREQISSRTVSIKKGLCNRCGWSYIFEDESMRVESWSIIVWSR